MFAIPTNERWVFGLIENKVFTAWVRVVSSRLESRYQISSTAVYNTMPFPELTKEQCEKVSQLVDKVLEVREKFSESSLGDLYDPLLMPIDLVKAQENLDKYILQIYGLKQNAPDEEILAELFRRYQELTDDKLI
jgi:hypothetical protein